jgi:hypothetical protein
VLEKLTWESNLRFWRHRDGRCLRTNRYYRRVHSAQAVGHAVADLDRAILDELLANPDAPFEQPGVLLLKDSRSATVAELDLLVNGRMRRVIYKRFRVTTWSDPWTALVRATPALRSWILGQGLRERMLPTPRPLLVLHRRRHGLVREGYLLMEKVEDAVDLHGFVKRLAGLDASERRRRLRCCIEEVARLIRKLHSRHLAHRDLKAANLLVAREAWQPAEHSATTTSVNPIGFIDLVGVARCRKLADRQRVANLTRLNASFHASGAVTRADRLRFLRVYLQWGLSGRESWKTWWRAIARATAAKVARNLRRRRPLA